MQESEEKINKIVEIIMKTLNKNSDFHLHFESIIKIIQTLIVNIKAASINAPESDKEKIATYILTALLTLTIEAKEILDLSGDQFISRLNEIKIKAPCWGDEVDELLAKLRKIQGGI